MIMGMIGQSDKSSRDEMLSRLFFNMLPVQVLIFAMGSINSIVDGTIAGRFIDSNAVAVIGLYYSMVSILQAIGYMLLGGATVLCGRYMGKGDFKKTEGIFSLNLTVTFIIGAILTAVSFIMPGKIAVMLGTNEELKADLIRYITGFAFGIIPMLLGQQIESFLQMERQSTRGYVGIAVMVISNTVFNILFVVVFNMGMWGLALATSASNLLYFLVLVPYYFTSKAQFHYRFKDAYWQDLGDMLKIGIPGALLVFCLSMRGIVINRILLQYSGNDGLSAMSAFNMIRGIFIAYCLGNGSIIRMLTSVFAGEEDKYSMRSILKIALTKGMLLSVALTGISLLISPFIAQLFFPDTASNVYRLNLQLTIIVVLCIPLILLCQVYTNYFQAMDHRLFVNVVSVFDGFFSMVIPSLILAPMIGALGVWLASPIGIVLTLLLVPIYAVIYWKHIPKNLDEWMFLSPDFGVSKDCVLDITVRDMDELMLSSAQTQEFCENSGMGKRASYYSALCLEEIAGYVITHGFNADKKKHSLDSMVINKGSSIMLRIKDDCIPFNPLELCQISSGEGDFDSIGIQMINKIADDITYQNMLGLNVLTVTFSSENELMNQETDYLLEKTLKELNEDLHQRFRNTVFATQKILTRYRQLFPEYTDHSELHSMTVIDSCNRLIGSSQIDKLNADEIYILLVAIYFHDVGMGVSDKDYDEFAEKLGEKDFYAAHPDAGKVDFVRTYHNELSGLFVEKYADLFDIPSKQHLFAIKQIVRGHRKTDLYSESEYPARLELPNGNTVCLPYLAALIRISDEIDVVATRNPLVMYDIETLTDEIEIVENRKLESIRSMRMTGNAFILSCKTNDENIFTEVQSMVVKMQKTLDYCRDVTSKRSEFEIRQSKVILKRI